MRPVLVLVLFVAATNVFAARLGPDPKRFRFYLQTIEVGDLIFNNFGHTTIRVTDPSTGGDMVFNWGIFNFEQDGFVINFYRGILQYELGVYPMSLARQRYQYEERTVWEDLIDLTPEEKIVLWDRLVDQMKPENRSYAYYYFFDNCATRPRDFINEAVGGRLHALFNELDSGVSYRQAVRHHYRYNWWVDLSLEVLMNGNLDRNMTKWEQMFLPKALRSHYMTAPSSTGSGPLLKPRDNVVSFAPPKEPALEPALAFLLWTFLPVSFVRIILAGRRRMRIGPVLVRRCIRLLGAFMVIYFFYVGLMGLLMPTNWIFSEHVDLHHNLNILVFWPIDLIFVYFGGRLLLSGRAFVMQARVRRALLQFLLLRLGIVFLAAGLSVASFVSQDITRVLFFIWPAGALQLYVFYRYATTCEESHIG